jgi:hypothetical protein
MIQELTGGANGEFVEKSGVGGIDSLITNLEFMAISALLPGERGEK